MSKLTLTTKQDATKYFWEETFPRVFSNMNDLKTVIKMSYQGIEVDRFIAKVFDDVNEKRDHEICLNCIFSSIKDIDFHEGKMHHSCSTGVSEYIFNDTPFVSEDFGCRKFRSKKKED